MKKISDSTKIILVYNMIFAILAILFYFITPEILNFPPHSINNEFERTIDSGMNFYQQYLVAILAVMLVGNIFIYSNIKGIKNYLVAQGADLENIKRKCFVVPYRIYLLQTIVPSIIVVIVMYLTQTAPILIVTTVALIFAFSTLLSLISYLYSKRIFKKLLYALNNVNTYDSIFNFNFKIKILMQFLPLIFVAILFPSIVGYSTLTKERGNLIFEEYKTLLVQNFKKEFNSYEELLIELNNLKLRTDYDGKFIIDQDKNVIFSEGSQISSFFIKYLFEVSGNLEGHIYDYYGSDMQGVAEKINIEGKNFYVGVIYPTSSYSGVVFLLSSMVFMLFVCILFLMYFSKDISTDLSKVANYLAMLSQQKEIDYDKKLPVTSNDEIGELVISFNKILDLEKKNIETMSRNQEIMIEQERLSSLGQLIGGIAHNLKTPIMSIAGAVEGLTDLIKEYDESVDDPKVTNEDHHEIAKDMQVWVDKIRPYLSYMTEVIDTVKGQAVSMNASTMKSFSAKELIARTQILLRDELKRRHCKLNLNLEVDEKSNIEGEISAIVQVIDNLIINAMDAYKDNGGDIDIHVHEDNEKIYIDVADYAGGIPEHVQDKLFKEMITSKGKNGTGLGLYMCYSTIKGKFNGDMSYKTETGKGTVFYIELNKSKESN